MAASEFAIKINRRDGALEVTGPDKEWVDAKIKQLGPAVSEYRADSGGESGRTSQARKQHAPGGGVKKEPPSNGPEASGKRRPRGTGGKPAINSDLQAKLTPDVRKDLEAYISARRKAWDGSQPAQAAIIATFLQDELDEPGVDTHDLYTVYRAMGERSPNNIRSQLVNARQRARYFSGVVGRKSVLSHAGENFARYDSLDGSNDEPASE